ncbi:MAG: hypothetical protein WD894_26780 [Pirellulales bacterium]
MDPSSLGDRLRQLAIALVRTFFFTWLAMAVGGIAIALATGYWMPDVDPVIRTLLQVFFAGQFIVVGFFVAMRCAMSAALIGGVKRMQLGRIALNLLMSRVGAGDEEARSEDPDVIDSPSSVPPVSRELSAVVAAERIQRVLTMLAYSGRSRRGGVFAWLRSALLGAVGTITLSRFRSKGRRAEKVDLASVQQELEDQIDDLLLARLRYTLFIWTALVVGVLIAEVAAISLLANKLAS